MMRPQGVAKVFFEALAFFAVGCSSDLPQTVPVHGVVRIDGGRCPAPGIISFAPLEVSEGMPRRPGSGKFDTDGAFVVTSFEEGDGLVPGRYRVRVECWKREPKPIPGDEEKATYVPLHHKLPELVIKPDTPSAIHVEYDVPMTNVR